MILLFFAGFFLILTVLTALLHVMGCRGRRKEKYDRGDLTLNEPINVKRKGSRRETLE
jgi:hypothetical protein